MPDELAKITESSIGKMSSMRNIKARLLEEHRRYNRGILQKLERTSTGFNTDQLLNLIVEDILNSSEDLQATSLMLESEGNVQNASAITIKRADLLRLVADIVSKRKELNQRSGEVDLNSPAFCIFQKLCFDKMVDSMEEMNLDTEMINLLLSRWQSKMKDWGKELKRALKDLDD